MSRIRTINSFYFNYTLVSFTSSNNEVSITRIYIPHILYYCILLYIYLNDIDMIIFIILLKISIYDINLLFNYFKLNIKIIFVIFTCFSFFNYFSYVSGNLVTVIALLKYTRLRRHATTAFVISLSISDLIFSAVNLPLTASRYLNEAWVLGETLCKIFPLFFYGNVAVSLLSMVAITINRLVILIKINNCYKNFNYFSNLSIFSLNVLTHNKTPVITKFLV